MIGTVFDSATTSLASACIYDAQNEIKKRLCKRYDFSASPFLTTTTLPPMITTLAETLALGYMYENMSRGGKEGMARAKQYIDRAEKNMDQLLAGDAQLTDSSGNLIDEIDGDWVIRTTEEYEPTFNEDDPKNWVVDQDKLDDIESDRS